MPDPIIPGYHNRRLGDPFPWGPERGVELGPGATLLGMRLGEGVGVGRLYESGRGEKSNQTTAGLSAEVDLFASRIPLVENKLKFDGTDGVGIKYSYIRRSGTDADARDHRIDLLYRLMFGERGQVEAFLGPTFMMGDIMEYGYGGIGGALYRFGDREKGTIPFLGLRMIVAGGSDPLGTRTIYAQGGFFAGLEFSTFVGKK